MAPPFVAVSPPIQCHSNCFQRLPWPYHVPLHCPYYVSLHCIFLVALLHFPCRFTAFYFVASLPFFGVSPPHFSPHCLSLSPHCLSSLLDVRALIYL